MMKCIFTSQEYNGHTDRWVQELKKNELYLDYMRLQDFNLKSRNLPDRTPIIIGPLNLISEIDFKNDLNYFGLSWGFDFQNIEIFLKYSKYFKGFIIDSKSNIQILINNGISKDVIFYLPWGVPRKQILEYAEIKNRKFFKNNKINILLPRNHEPVYNNELIIESLKELPNISQYHISLTGEGSMTKFLFDQLQKSKLKDNFNFLGNLRENDFIKVLDDSDICISAAKIDGTSVTLLQSMARGVPVLVSDTANNRDWVQDNQTGYLFNLYDKNSISIKLSQALNSDFRSIIIKAHEQVIKEAVWETNFKFLVNWMKSISIN